MVPGELASPDRVPRVPDWRAQASYTEVAETGQVLNKLGAKHRSFIRTI